MSKRERTEEGPEYILLEVQDAMEPATSCYFYRPRSGLTSEQLEEIADNDVDMFDEDGDPVEPWKTLDNEAEVRKFTREQWCEVMVVNDE